MGKEKAGFLTPKAISNRIKAKGLQKLRWYCQMCQKQCRDENGFKCHTMSESHQRQLLLVADNPGKFVNTFSQEFCETFIELLRRRFGTKRVHGNVVYQEYIADRNHIHMNATQWVTLTQFVKWLGRKGYCTVDETEKGWFIQYIDRTPEAVKRQQALEKKAKMDVDDEDRRNKMIQQQMERDKKRRRKNKNGDGEDGDGENGEGDDEDDDDEGSDDEDEDESRKPTELMKSSEDEKVVFKIPVVPETNRKNVVLAQSALETSSLSSSSSSKHKVSSKHLDDLETMSTCSGSSSLSTCSTTSVKRKPSALEEIMEMEETKKAKIGSKDYWLVKGIVVKIVTKKAGDQYHKKKAIVKRHWSSHVETRPESLQYLQYREVIDKYGAIVKLLDSGDKVKLDQVHLETVLPSIGKQVHIVNGGYRGQTAILQGINVHMFSCNVTIDSGPLNGRVLNNVPYEDVCKIYQPS